jgi:hypothetical protein
MVSRPTCGTAYHLFGIVGHQSHLPYTQICQDLRPNAVQGFGLDILERVPIQIVPNQANVQYLKTKQEKMGHLLEKLQNSN